MIRRLFRECRRRYTRWRYRRRADDFFAAAEAIASLDLIDLCAVEIARRKYVPAAELRGLAQALDRYADQLEREQRP